VPNSDDNTKLPVEQFAESKTGRRTKIAGEVRFIKDRSGDKSEWAWGSQGPSEREMTPTFQFQPSAAKPLAAALRSSLMALGHCQSAQNTFVKIKSATVSPDGSLGGKGYIQKISDMRRQFANCAEVLSALSDTLYDEIHAPHWNPAIEENLSGRDREQVEEILSDAEEIREDPEGWAEEEEEEMDEENEAGGKQARSKTASARKWFVTKRGGTPYGGPAWGDDKPQWFNSEREAKEWATKLTKRNPAGFRAEQIPEGFEAGKYPRMKKVRGAATIEDLYYLTTRRGR